jgi:hypothetical protein
MIPLIVAINGPHPARRRVGQRAPPLTPPKNSGRTAAPIILTSVSRPPQVGSGPVKKFGVIMKPPKTDVTLMTKKPANPAGLMAMVNQKVFIPAARLFSKTDGTFTVLRGKQA